MRENRWRALRDGLEAAFIELEAIDDVRTRDVAETFDRTARMLEPTVEKLGIKDEIAHLQGIVRRGETGADRQRRIHEEEGDLRAVVADVAERTVP